MSTNNLPSIISPELVKSLYNHSLPSIRNNWYLIAVVTVSVLNRPDEVPAIYRHAIGPNKSLIDPAPSAEQQIRISRRIREALIKTSAVAGVPKVINALLALKEATPEEFQDKTLQPSPTSRRDDMYKVPQLKILSRGQSFFEKVYGKISSRVMQQMENSGTEDLGLVARLMYGHVLSNTNVLNGVETSFVMIAAIIPQDINPQLKGHLRGALNGGAEVQDVKAVREIVIQICKNAGMSQLDNSNPSGWGWREEIADL